MIDIELQGEIRRKFHVEHMSINAISVHLEVHHDTVRRALRSEKFCNKRFRSSILEPWQDFINETVVQYPHIKSPRMTELIKDRGYQGSISSVRAYLAKVKRRINIPYLRLETFPSEQAQVDWADFGKILVEGGQRRLSTFVMVLSYSRAIYARFCYDQTIESLQSFHIEAFNVFRGVPRTILYDNMKSAVIERCAGHIRFNENLLELASHYRFAPKACQPYAGNQKGRVERSIRYIRDNFFAARTFTNLDDLNRQFLRWQDEIAFLRKWPQNKDKTVREAFQEEQGALIPLPEFHFDPSRLAVVRSGKTPYVKFDCNHYSIPHTLVGRPLTLRVTPESVAIYDDTEKVAEHLRCWAKDRHIEDVKHIEGLHEYKKSHRTYRNRSVLTTRLPDAAALLPMWMERGDNLGRNSQKLLDLLEKYDADSVKSAILTAIAKNAPAVESISYILGQNFKTASKPMNLILPAHLKQIEIRSHDPSQYDQLINCPERQDHGTTDGT